MPSRPGSRQVFTRRLSNRQPGRRRRRWSPETGKYLYCSRKQRLCLGGEPISTYEMRYGESGNSDSQKQVGNVSGEAYVVDNLTNGKGYQFAIAAISRGGKGPYSNFASSTPSN